MNLAEICDNAKKGREYALLGNYDTSAVYYQGVLQQIHKHCQTLRDPALKVKWQQVSSAETPEHAIIRQFFTSCSEGEPLGVWSTQCEDTVNI